jgi:hypothetical protein
VKAFFTSRERIRNKKGALLRRADWLNIVKDRVARLLLVYSIPKWGEIDQMNIKYIPNGRKIDQMIIKYTNIFYCKTLRNLPEMWIFFWFENLASGNPGYECMRPRFASLPVQG